MSEKDRLCIIPWLHFTYDGGNLSPCCRMFSRFTPEPVKGNLVEVLNSEKFQEIRKQFLKNEIPQPCSKCFADEDHGATSDRMKFNHLFREDLERLSRDKENTKIDLNSIKYVDLRLSNLCNQSCRTCDSYSSTAWNKDALKLGDISSPQNRKGNLEDLGTFDQCLRYSFAGGEPLLEPMHLDFLRKLSTQENAAEISLEYNSNIDIDEKRLREFITYWKKFKSVQVAASIDHVEVEKMKYIRNGCDFERIMKNGDLLNQVDHVDLGIQLTLSIYNMMDLDSILHFFQKRWKLPIDRIEIYILHDPEIYHISNILDDCKEVVKARLKSLLDGDEGLSLQENEFYYLSGKIRSILGELSQPEKSEVKKELLKRTEELDHLRNQDFFQVFSKII